MNTSQNFQLYSQYYDLLYQDKNYQTEATYVLEKLKSYLPNISSMLDLGSGSGEHARFFCENGLKITGIELSKGMVEKAKSKNISLYSPNQGDIRNFSLDQTFDVVISLFHVISYLTTNQDLINCFSQIYKHLQKGGIFLFDVWYLPAVMIQKPVVRVKRMENKNIKVTRIAEPNHKIKENVVEVNFEVFIQDKTNNRLEVIKETHPMRYFSIPEITLLANMTGFDVINYGEFLSDKPLSEHTWGACFILKKKS